MSLRIILISTVLMMGGVSFGYFVAIPAALQFLMNFGGDFVTANLTADSYLSFVVAYLLGLGLLFQLPLLLVLWNWIQPFKPGGLLNTQRYVLVGAFIAAALITPTPDVLNQCLIAVPIIAIYQLGVMAVFTMNRRAARRQSKLDKKRERARVASEAFRQSRTRPVAPAPPAAAPKVFSPQPVAAPPSAVPDGRTPRRRAVDGFARVRASSVGVPSRSRPVTVQHRPTTLARSSRTPVRPRQASVDGFSFVS